ncbi:MAG: TonB-dependent receptor plug domain-containing protein, partial [Arenicella sp.]|nr:TonB-dependent receptor plug domain-containing protein [Arenicella sp.]
MRVAKKSFFRLKIRQRIRLRLGRPWATAFIVLSLSVVLDTHAEKENRVFYDILATTLSDALFQVASQSDLQLIIQQTEMYDDKVDIKLLGAFTLEDVLKQVLDGHEFEYELINNSTIIVRSILALKDEPNLVLLNKSNAVNGTLDEIVVSARKRKQNIMTVPQHVATISEQQINENGIQRVEDIRKQVLSMTFSQKRGYDQSSLRIRGIGTQVLGAGVEPSVSTVVDGVVMARGGAQFNELPDVERIEVLNGPQGILYGKNVSAGLVSIITKRPNAEHNEARVRAYITSDKDVGAKFSVSGPVSDKFSYRLSGARRKWDGNANNVTTGNLVNGVDTGYVSGKINWSVNDKINVLLSGDYSNQKTECCARITRDDRLGIFVDPSFVGDSREGGSIESILGFVASDDSNTIAQNRDPIQNSINSGISLEVVAKLNGHMLTSLTAARKWQSENSWD